MKKNILLIVIILILSHFTADFFGSLYLKSFSTEGGFLTLSTSATGYLYGLPSAYLFFTWLLFMIFDQGRKNKHALIVSIPAILYVVFGDLRHIYFYAAFVILGWLIGWGIAKLMHRSGSSTL